MLLLALAQLRALDIQYFEKNPVDESVQQSLDVK